MVLILKPQQKNDFQSQIDGLLTSNEIREIRQKLKHILENWLKNVKQIRVLWRN